MANVNHAAHGRGEAGEMFALVYYQDTPNKYTVISVKDVYDFKPKGENDYNKNKWYPMRWYGDADEVEENRERFNELGCDMKNWYKGAIVKLSSSRNIDIDDSKRMKKDKITEPLTALEQDLIYKGSSSRIASEQGGSSKAVAAYYQNKESSKLKQASLQCAMSDNYFNSNSKRPAAANKKGGTIVLSNKRKADYSSDDNQNYSSDETTKSKKKTHRENEKTIKQKKKVNLHENCDAELQEKQQEIEDLKAELKKRQNKICSLQFLLDEERVSVKNLTTENLKLRNLNIKHQNKMFLLEEKLEDGDSKQESTPAPNKECATKGLQKTKAAANDGDFFTGASSSTALSSVTKASLEGPSLASGTTSNGFNETSLEENVVNVVNDLNPPALDEPKEDNSTPPLSTAQETSTPVEPNFAVPISTTRQAPTRYKKKEDSKSNLYGLFSPTLADETGQYPAKMTLLAENSTEFHIINGVTLAKNKWDAVWTNVDEDKLTTELLKALKTEDQRSKIIWKRDKSQYDATLEPLETNIKKALVYCVLKKRACLGGDTASMEGLKTAVNGVQSVVSNITCKARNKLLSKK